MKDKVKFIYFDVGGVLFNWKGALKALANQFGVTYRDTLKVFKKYNNDVCRGIINPDVYLKHYEKELGKTANIDRKFAVWWTDHFLPIPQSHKLLIDLSKKYNIGLLTNIYKGSYEENIRKSQIPKINYAQVLKSCDLQMIKPEKEFFLHAQEKAGVEPQELLLIDDTKENIEAAKKLGWKAMLFDEADPKGSSDKIRQALL